MLKLEHVVKDYRCFKLNCSMEVREGFVTGLIGKNGAGKTTTFLKACEKENLPLDKKIKEF